jgi:hypothetical protein
MSRRTLPAVVSWLVGLVPMVVVASQQLPTFRVGVDLVTVDVSVTRGGHPISGLKPENFAVFDNGVRQKLEGMIVEQVPLDATLVLDTSGSLAGARLAQAGSAADRCKGRRDGPARVLCRQIGLSLSVRYTLPVPPSRQSTYRPQAEDTEPAVDRRLIEAYRAMTPAEKGARIAADSVAIERLALAGIALRNPSGTSTGGLLELATLRLGRACARRSYARVTDGLRNVPVSTTDPIALAGRVAGIFESMGIRCVVGGSVASSVFGEPRATEDVDLVADLQPRHVIPLLQALGDDFYVEEAAVRRAIERRASFNLIHLPSARKIDVFVPARTVLGERQLQRRRLVPVSEDSSLYLLSPEDTVLQKLDWYRKGGGVSERQWRDVLGVIKVQADRLDWNDLERTADEARLRDLLERARSEATPQSG